MTTSCLLKNSRWLGQSRGAQPNSQQRLVAAMPRSSIHRGIASRQSISRMANRERPALPQPPKPRRLFLTLVVSCLALPGCAKSSGYERYVPAPALAAEALNQVLAAWQSGDASQSLASCSSPITIHVVDTTRQPGQRLADYEVLGEISGEGPRTFAVRLKFENPSLEEKALYYLVGIDPLWVFRQEDYDAVAHWDVCARQDQPATPTRQHP